MARIPESGPIRFSAIAEEFGLSPPYRMSNLSAVTGGTFRFGVMRGAVNEIVIEATSGSNVDISSLFGSDWTDTKAKRLTVPAGVTIGGTGSSAALIIPANMGGTLEIDNAGSIIGFGGAANGGAGGNAIQNLASGVTINNTGLLAGGGGGGGNGGNGGNGSFTSTTNYGAQYLCAGNSRGWKFYYGSSNNWFYEGNQNPTDCSYVKGGAAGFCSFIDDTGHYITRICSSTTNTSGGAGGSGGVGQGYNQTNTSGSGGASGGTNAGTGGTGGSGATYGTAGSTGSTGANGNSSNGSGGASGGSAGAAVYGTVITINNSGNVYGAIA